MDLKPLLALNSSTLEERNACTITKASTSLLDTLFVNAFKCRDKQRTVRTVPSSFQAGLASITVEFALIS